MDIQNRKAKYNYEILDTYVTGIVLNGSEVKSVRVGKATLADSHCAITNNELWMYNSYIANNEINTSVKYNENRPRKLLAKKHEIRKLFNDTKNKGLTIVPLNMHFEHGLCKVKIALCKGKKEYDKRETIKERDITRELNKTLKY